MRKREERGEEGGNQEKKRRRGEFKGAGEIRIKKQKLDPDTISDKEEGRGKELIDPICFKPKFSRAIPSIY